MKILVIGSINVDLITETQNIPDKGETIFGKNFTILPGGKGANQAVFAGLLGAEVCFYGKVGNDEFSELALQNFHLANIDIKHIYRSNKFTGLANVILSDKDNRIIVIPGANADFKKSEFDPAILDNFDIIVLQLELPIDFIEHIINLAKKKNKLIILNPAPYDKKLTRNMIDNVSFVTPNEIEAQQIFGDNYLEEIKNYPNKVIITQGEKGVIYYDGSNYVRIPANKIEVVDTTGAGDAFNGALAYMLSKNNSLYSSIQFAVKKASETVKYLGTQTAYIKLTKE